MCLDIKNKISALKKIYNLVKILNINDGNEKKCYCVSTDFIRKLTGFFITIGEKTSTNIPLSQMYHVRKGATLTRLYVPMYLNLDDYPPFSDKNRSFLRHILTET